MYLFSALASNDFGNSSFSGNSDPISVQAEGILLYTFSVASPSPTATVTPTGKIKSCLQAAILSYYRLSFLIQLLQVQVVLVSAVKFIS